MAATAGQVTPLAKSSEEYTRIEHTLQLAVQSTGVKEVSIWAISNPQLNVEFERRSAPLLRLDSWVDVNALDDQNAIQEVCQRGFRVSADGGALFHVGAIPFAPNGQTQHQFLLCSVAVGRSFVLDSPEAERKLPPGYDSLYVHDPAAEAAASGAGASSASGSPDGGPAYAHRYVVFDGAQVLPRYVVHFTHDPAAPLPRHKAGDINLAELKTKIAEALSVLGPSASAAAEKMLADVGSNYERALSKSAEPDSLLEERKRSIADALRVVDDKLSAIQANSKSVEDTLYARMQEAIFALQDATQKKMNALLSEELELRRQLGQIAWVEGFVNTMQETLPPMTFITAWERHAAVRAGMYSALGGRVSTRALDDIQPDMAVVGSIAVVAGKQAAAAAAAAQAATAAGQALPPAPSTLPPPPSSPGGAGAGAVSSNVNLNDLLSSILKAQLGGSGAGGAGAAASMPAAPVPIITVEQARANYERAKADVAAVEAMAASLPRDMKAQGDAARVQAAARLVEAEGIYTAHASRAAASAGGAGAGAAGTASSAGSPAAQGRGVEQAGGSAAGAGAASSTLARSASTASAATASAAGGSASAGTAAGTTLAVGAPTPRVTGAAIPLEQRLARYSLYREADRKRRQRALEGLDPSLAFADSSILTPEQAQALYMCLPWGGAAPGMDETMGMGGMFGQTGLGSMPPVARLLFASDKHFPPSVTTMVTNYMQAGARDATVLVVRANGYVFGGYAADAWDLSQYYGGTPRCFLFSISRDARIPFTGRVKGPRQANDDQLRATHEEANQQAQAEFEALVAQAREQSGQEPVFDEAGRLVLNQLDDNGMPTTVRIPVPRPKPFVRHDAIRSGPDFVQFGLKDLILRGDFSECSSELEHGYGVGLRPDDARTLLAGAPSFRADAVELWAISPAMMGQPMPDGMGGMSMGMDGGMGMGMGGYGGYTTPMH